ncbi:hypothetical protein Sango_1742800 [Sesamum angolense]|uniref:Reverse transcriptase Ty1/copia-type domain-containing protein n=1 Tax=Sesamum angolense TaxID=2727404 RepID=A0AAE2BSG4_9LAMI|nr:hypothetical protein Sango_1742800 [Sesamum angolense]
MHWANILTVCLFLALAAAHVGLDVNNHMVGGWINNAFLHEHLDEDLYMAPPEGYFVDSVHDHCLFIKSTPIGLLVYVDDILVAGPCMTAIQAVKSYVHSLFTIKDIGDAIHFLGLEIARNPLAYMLHKLTHGWPLPQMDVNNAFLHEHLDEDLYMAPPEGYFVDSGLVYKLERSMYDCNSGSEELSSLSLYHQGHWRCNHFLGLEIARNPTGIYVHKLRMPFEGFFLPSQSNFELQAYCGAEWASCIDSSSASEIVL